MYFCNIIVLLLFLRIKLNLMPI